MYNVLVYYRIASLESVKMERFILGTLGEDLFVVQHDNLRKVHELIQNKPWADDILEQIQTLIDKESSVPIRRMMSMSMSSVINKLENNK